MSFLKKGGTGNPFATGGQSDGGQPSRGFQGNNNNTGGGRGGGRFHEQQGNPGRGQGGQQGSAFAGGRGGGGAQSGNPFATGRGGGNQNQQVNFGHAQSHQHHQQNTHNSNQTASKGNFNPFASGGGGGGGSMDMDGGGQMSGGFGRQHPPRPQNTASNNSGRGGSANPFAASSHQGVGNVFASNGASASCFGGGQSSVNSSASSGHGAGFPAQKQNPFQAQHQQPQGFPNNAGFAQNQQQSGASFGSRAPAQPAGNPFFGGGHQQHHQQHQQHHGYQSAPTAFVRAEVNQQAINAVNMSAALAPSQVEELDLGLGAGLLDAGISSSIAAQEDSAALPVPPPISTGASAEQGSESSAAQQVKALLSSILSSCPATALSEEPPQQADVYKLGTALVAGRIPAVPPARAAASAARRAGQSVVQANPFGSAPKPAFGAFQ